MMRSAQIGETVALQGKGFFAADTWQVRFSLPNQTQVVVPAVLEEEGLVFEVPELDNSPTSLANGEDGEEDAEVGRAGEPAEPPSPSEEEDGAEQDFEVRLDVSVDGENFTPSSTTLFVSTALPEE